MKVYNFLFKMLLIFLISFTCFSDDTKFLVGLNYENSSSVFEYYRPYYREIFKRAGIKYDVIYYPSERILIALNQGITDADFARVDLGDRYPNIIKINEPVIISSMYVYTLNENTSISSWEELYDKKVVGIIGHKAVEFNLKNKMTTGEFYQVSKIDQAIKLIETGRYNYFVSLDVEPDFYLRDNLNIKKSEKPIKQYLLYIYVNKRHKDKVGKLEQIIRDLKEEKFLENYYKNKPQD